MNNPTMILEDVLPTRREFRCFKCEADEEAAKTEAAKPIPKQPAKLIALDFDGTCVTHEFPDIGKDVPYCFEVLKRLEANGVGIILWTMRSGQYLTDAVDWFKQKNIPLWGINGNPAQKSWTQSPKCYAPIYIDDAALGCPLRPSYSGGRPMVDWWQIEKILQEKNYL